MSRHLEENQAQDRMSQFACNGFMKHVFSCILTLFAIR